MPRDGVGRRERKKRWGREELVVDENNHNRRKSLTTSENNQNTAKYKRFGSLRISMYPLDDPRRRGNEEMEKCHVAAWLEEEKEKKRMLAVDETAN